jgi:hypothetical protein
MTPDQACPAIIPFPLPELHLDAEDLLVCIGLTVADAWFYAPAFDEQGFDSEATLQFLTAANLNTMGMINVEHRLLLLDWAVHFPHCFGHEIAVP